MAWFRFPPPLIWLQRRTWTFKLVEMSFLWLGIGFYEGISHGWNEDAKMLLRTSLFAYPVLVFMYWILKYSINTLRIALGNTRGQIGMGLDAELFLLDRLVDLHERFVRAIWLIEDSSPRVINQTTVTIDNRKGQLHVGKDFNINQPNGPLD